MNDAFLRASGRDRDALLGRRLFDAFPANPDDPGDTGLGALRASLRRVVTTHRTDVLPLQRYPIRVQTPEGDRFEERWWDARSTPIFDSGGRLACIEHRTEDVTERHRVAEALRSSTERQAFQLALADRLRPLTSAEGIARAASAMLGERFAITRVAYVEVDDASGTFVQRHWESRPGDAPPPERRHLSDFGAAIIATLRRGEALVIRDVATDPRTAPHASAYASIGVRANLAIPLVKAGALSIVLSLQHDAPRDWTPTEIALATDVAERTWAAAENARAQQALVEADRRKDEFLAMLAHELRNPLAPIANVTAILGRLLQDVPRTQQAVQILDRQTRQLSRLVDDLLDISRVAQGRISLRLQAVEVDALIEQSLESVQHLAHEKHQTITVTRTPGPLQLVADRARLVQVLSNVLHNACKYTADGGAIALDVTATADEVLVTIADDGPGIAPDLLPRLFELFVQGERTLDRAQGGLGVGLSIVKRIVEMHGGRVAAASPGLGRGATFTLVLPRSRAAG